MQLFKGLTSNEVHVLRKSAQFRQVVKGEMIFREHDPAYGLYSIVQGAVEIVRNTHEGEVRLAELGEEEVFGEMGILRDTGTRTATARATKDTLLYEIPGNPVDALQDVKPIAAALKLLKNLICILGDRLRQKDDPASVRIVPGHGPTGGRDLEGPLVGQISDPMAALEVIESKIPKGLLKSLMLRKKLSEGDFLCRQGDDPDGFYFLQEGEAEVVIEDGESQRVVNTLQGPSIAGEVGFFGNEKRSASLRAAPGGLNCIHFSAKDFKKLEKDSPEDAFKVLFAAAQLTVILILERETASRS